MLLVSGGKVCAGSAALPGTHHPSFMSVVCALPTALCMCLLLYMRPRSPDRESCFYFPLPKKLYLLIFFRWPSLFPRERTGEKTLVPASCVDVRESQVCQEIFFYFNDRSTRALIHDHLNIFLLDVSVCPFLKMSPRRFFHLF